jgi:hypothetical protein
MIECSVCVCVTHILRCENKHTLLRRSRKRHKAQRFRKCYAPLVQRFRYILDIYIRYTVLEVSNKADRKAIDGTDFLADGVDIEERLHRTSQKEKQKMHVTAVPIPRTQLGCFRNTPLSSGYERRNRASPQTLACVGCSPVPSPALMMGLRMKRATFCTAPFSGCRRTTMSLYLHMPVYQALSY